MTLTLTPETATVPSLGELCGHTRTVVESLEPALLSTDDATRLVRDFAELEKLAAAGKTLLADRAAEGDLWKRAGDQSPAHWLARKSGSSLAAADRTLQTSKQLGALDATRGAFCGGDLSADQASAVAAGATADPRAEDELLRHAYSDTLHGLRQRSDAKIAAADPTPEKTRERIHQGRYARKRHDPDGAGRIEIRDNPDVIAAIWFAAAPFCDTVFNQARKDGIRDKHDAYMADAFAAMAQAATAAAQPDTADPEAPATAGAKTGGSRKPLFILLGDLAPIVRGHLHPGETLEIPGFGPYPVQAARELLFSDAIIHLVLTHGRDPHTIVTKTRHVADAVRSSLWPRDRECIVPGCNRTAGLEIHHTTSPTGYADTRETRLDLLGLLCEHHHDDVTHRGAQLTGNHPDGWHYQPPPPERHNQPSPYNRENHPPSRN